MKMELQDILIEAIKEVVKGLGYEQTAKEDVVLDLTKESHFGDLTTNIALRLGRLTKKSPQELAVEIITGIKNLVKNQLEKHVKEIKVEGAGFINFYLTENYFYCQLKQILLRKENFAKVDYGKKKRVLIEFVSANPTGPLSIAHARQAAVGDVLANILEFLGFKVKREYYLNDEGNQIDILGKSIALRLKELEEDKPQFPEDYYHGEYITDIAKEAKQAKCKIQNLGDFGAKYILKIIKKELEDFGVRFDCWFSQKALRKSGKIENALDFLKRKRFVYEQEGARWFKSTRFGDDKDRVVVKSDGAYTYLAPDIAYHQEKYRRGFSWLINLWGPDHHGYVSRLKAGVEALGHHPKTLSIIIVQLASILRNGAQVEMSTRRGEYITLREVLNEVGRDAARFFFLMRRTSSHLDFDLEIARKQTPENPVYYVQYAHARICSILRNSPLRLKFYPANLRLLKEKEEIELIKKLWQFPYTVDICFKNLDPYLLTAYLQEVAELLHRFYDRHRVLGKDARLSKSRLLLIKATRIVLNKGLELLSISRPKKM